MNRKQGMVQGKDFDDNLKRVSTVSQLIIVETCTTRNYREKYMSFGFLQTVCFITNNLVDSSRYFIPTRTPRVTVNHFHLERSANNGLCNSTVLLITWIIVKEFKFAKIANSFIIIRNSNGLCSSALTLIIVKEFAISQTPSPLLRMIVRTLLLLPWISLELLNSTGSTAAGFVWKVKHWT
jgi:hypothetical protein